MSNTAQTHNRFQRNVSHAIIHQRAIRHLFDEVQPHGAITWRQRFEDAPSVWVPAILVTLLLCYGELYPPGPSRQSSAPMSGVPSPAASRFPGVHSRTIHTLCVACAGRCCNEHFFQTSIAVLVESSSGQWFSTSHDTSSLRFVFRTHVRDDGQAHVAPKLTFRSEAMRRVYCGDNECCSNRTQPAECRCHPHTE